MPSGADLFVVCKQCGSEVSPYVTECPYCGNRLRRRAPKLPKANTPPRVPRKRSRMTALLTRSRPRAVSAARRAELRTRPAPWAVERPYATLALVVASCAVWVVWHAKPDLVFNMAIVGPLNGRWWKLLTSEFIYENGLYAFVVLAAIAIFGWLVERRHGPVVVLALFFGASVIGALVADAVYELPLVSGANAAALALIAAWAAPDLEALRKNDYYEGDLLGAGAMAALVLAIPFARAETSWLAGVAGGVLGLVVGVGLHRLAEAQAQ